MKHQLAAKKRHQDLISLIRQGSKKSTAEESVLLDVSFPDFCKSLRIKTAEGVREFELFDWQEQFAELLLDNPRTPISLLSSRQTGKSAVILALLIWLSLTREQFLAVVVHRKNDDVKQLARRCKLLIPDGVKLESDSLSLIEFAGTNSQIHFRSCNPKNVDGHEGTGRGIANCDAICIDESSHTRNTADVLGVLGPTMTHSSMANVILIGTAGRRESYFYDTLAKCYGNSEALEQTLEGIRQGILEPYQEKRSDNRISVITNWRSIPRFANEQDYLKRIKKEQDLSESQINSEHELIFDSDASLSVFDFKLVMAAQSGSFEDSDSEAVYYAGIDGSGKPRPGRKGDFTVCCILKKQDDGKLKLVRLYRKRGISFQRRYAEICEALNDYKPVFSFVESGDGLGQTYLENIQSGCPSLDIDRFATNDTKKAGLVGRIELALEKGDLIIPKSPVVDELLSFCQLENGKMEAFGKDAHDDTVMALGFALEAARYGIRGIYG